MDDAARIAALQADIRLLARLCIALIDEKAELIEYLIATRPVKTRGDFIPDDDS